MRLDDEALRRLRDALARIHASRGREVPRDALAALGDALPPDVGVTIDFDAAASLGHPLVVLRPRADDDGESEADAALACLTPREREVAGLVATGLRNKDVAIALGITVATVKDHVHRILDKTGLDSRTALAALYHRR